MERRFVSPPTMFCQTCRAYVVIHGTYTGVCPACGNAFGPCICMRCGRVWNSRSRDGAPYLPIHCPGCGSPYWNRARSCGKPLPRPKPAVVPKLGEDPVIVDPLEGSA